MILSVPFAPSPFHVEHQRDWTRAAERLGGLMLLLGLVTVLWMIVSPQGRAYWRGFAEKRRIARMARGARHG